MMDEQKYIQDVKNLLEEERRYRETKVGIILSVRNCVEYTKRALDSIKTSHDYAIYVIDDHSNDGTKDWLATQPFQHWSDIPESTGLAFNWNWGIKRAIEDGCTHFFVINNDILLHPATIDNLVSRLDRGDVVMASCVNVSGLCATPEAIFTMPLGEESETEHPDFSGYMINSSTLESVGYLDETFRGCYFEDNDYHARIVLSGNKAISYNLAPFYHFASRTLAEGNVAGHIQQSFSTNQQHFREKWGCGTVSDTPEMLQAYWKHPYNDQNKSIKDW